MNPCVRGLAGQLESQDFMSTDDHSWFHFTSKNNKDLHKRGTFNVDNHMNPEIRESHLFL